MGEARVFATILEKEDVRPKSVLELFASTDSRHKDFFKLQYHYWNEIETYKGLDGFAPPDSNVIVADAGHGEYGEKFDAIFAYFYSASSAVDPASKNGRVTWEYMQSIFENVRKHLNPGGIFLIDSVTDGYQVAMATMSQMDEETEEYEAYIPLGHSLREEMKREGVAIEDADEVTMKTKRETIYDRMSANAEDWYKAITIYVNDEPRFIFKLEQPFCQRYFSEPEIIRIAQLAGFEDIDFWKGEYDDGTAFYLPSVITGLDEDEAEALMPNVFVARAPK
jgi:hypothetical protein